METENFSSQDLYTFVKSASESTWAGNGEYEKTPERSDHFELAYKNEGSNLEYRDSFTGHTRSLGSEEVRLNGKPIWGTGYGGGMYEGYEEMADATFAFLKKAMKTKEEGFESFRGPHLLEDGDWKYEYKQEGNTDSFNGFEEISYKRK